MKIDKVLVPLDGSTLAEQALTKALDLAESREPTLLLLRAAEASTWPGTDPTDGQVRTVREAEQYLEAVKRDLAAKGIRRVETSVAEAVLRGTTTPILLLRADGAPLERPVGTVEERGTAGARR